MTAADAKAGQGGCVQAAAPHHAVCTCVWVHKRDAPGALGSHVAAKHTNPQHRGCDTGGAAPADRGCAAGGMSILGGATRRCKAAHGVCQASGTQRLRAGPRSQMPAAAAAAAQRRRRPSGPTVGADGSGGAKERQEPAHVEQAHTGIQPDAVVIQASHTPAGRGAGGQAARQGGGVNYTQVHRCVPPTQQSPGTLPGPTSAHLRQAGQCLERAGRGMPQVQQSGLSAGYSKPSAGYRARCASRLAAVTVPGSAKLAARKSARQASAAAVPVCLQQGG